MYRMTDDSGKNAKNTADHSEILTNMPCTSLFTTGGLTRWCAQTSCTSGWVEKACGRTGGVTKGNNHGASCGAPAAASGGQGVTLKIMSELKTPGRSMWV
eukprot:362201-Chlamydomonas_euryale.AAC.4